MRPSLEALRQARELLDAVRRDNPRNPRILFALAKLNRTTGLALYNRGRLDETLKIFEATHPILEDLVALEPGLPENHAELAGNEYSLGLLLAASGKIDEALKNYGTSLSRRRRLAALHPGVAKYRLDVAATLGNIAGQWFEAKNDLVRAAGYFQEATTILESLARDYPAVATYSEYLARSRTNLAATMNEMGRHVEALAIARAAEPFAEQRVRAQPGVVQYRADLAFIAYSQGTFCLGLRRADDAEQFTRRALEILKPIQVATRENPHVLRLFCWSYRQLGRIELDRDRPADARAWYQRAIDVFPPGQAPADVQGRLDLASAFMGRFWANAQLHRTNEALADWDRLVTLGEPEQINCKPLGAILLRAWSSNGESDGDGFLAVARQAVESGLVPVDELITFAEAAAQAAGRAAVDPALPNALRTRRADELATQAVDWLRRAAAAGYFRTRSNQVPLLRPRFDALPSPRLPCPAVRRLFPGQPFRLADVALTRIDQPPPVHPPVSA